MPYQKFTSCFDDKSLTFDKEHIKYEYMISNIA